MALPRLAGGRKSSPLRGPWRTVPGLRGGQAGRQALLAQGPRAHRAGGARDSRGDLQGGTQQLRRKRGQEGVLGRGVRALRRRLCCDCVSLEGWIMRVTSVAWCCARGTDQRAQNTCERGQAHKQSRRREAGSEAVFKFLLLSLVAVGYCTAHLTLPSNFLRAGGTQLIRYLKRISSTQVANDRKPP